MELSEQDKQDIAAATVLIWKLGVHNPDDAAVAFNLTQLAKRLAPRPPLAGSKEEVKP